MNILRFDLNKPDSRSVNRLPAGVEGEKSLMMWKELCRTGHYETDGNSHDITPDFFQKMIDSFNARRGKGVEIPVPLGHTHNPEDKRGRVLYLETRKNKQGGFSLWGIIEFLSEEFKEALKNSDVSIDAPEETTDGDGKTWEFTLEHVALTDYPVVAGMEGFKEVKFSVLRDAIMEKWTLDTLIVKLGLTGTYSSPSKVYSAIYRKFQQLTGFGVRELAPVSVPIFVRFRSFTPPLLAPSVRTRRVELRKSRCRRHGSRPDVRLLSRAFGRNLGEYQERTFSGQKVPGSAGVSPA